MQGSEKISDLASFEAIPDALVLLDREGSIVFANRHAERVFGYERGKLVGLTIKSLIPERDLKEHAWLVDGLFARPTARPMGTSRKLHGLRSDGKEFPAEIAVEPSKSATYTVVVVHDITAVVKVRAKLDKSETDSREWYSNGEINEI